MNPQLVKVIAEPANANAATFVFASRLSLES